jgi:hypothetical protein
MPQPKKKPLTQCEKYGHSWMPTTAVNYQKCTRSGCNAAQRLRAGIGNTVSVQSENTSSEQIEHVSLWG